MMRSLSTRRRRMGVALGEHLLTAIGPGGVWTRGLEWTGNENGAWSDLTQALSDLAELLGARGAALHVALMPPLVQWRRVELPGLREHEARHVMSRDRARYLLAERETQEIAVEGSGWRARSPFSLLAVPRSVLGAIGRAAEDSGWQLAEVVSAEAAWAAASHELWSTQFGSASGTLAVCLDSRIELLRVRGGRLLGMRRFPSALKPDIASLLGEAGVTIHDAPEASDASTSAAAIAARFAPSAAGPSLLPEPARTARERRITRGVHARLAATAVMLAGVALLELWGIDRERRHVSAGRNRLRGAVSHAVAVRDTLGMVTGRLTLIGSLGTSARRSSVLIARISAALPPDAFLSSLRVEGDTMHVEGTAAQAALVFDAFGRMPGVRAVRPDGPIRQEVHEGTTTAEHFALTILLAPRDSVAASSTRLTTTRAGAP